MPVASRVMFDQVDSTGIKVHSIKLHSLPSRTSFRSISTMEIMSLSNLAMRQLGAYVPFLQSGVISDSWFAPLIEWGIRIVIVGLFATAFQTGRSKHGPWESVRMGECPGMKDL